MHARRHMRGFEGWGRHLCSGPATAAKRTFALTHPSNLREPEMTLTDDDDGSVSPSVIANRSMTIRYSVDHAAAPAPRPGPRADAAWRVTAGAAGASPPPRVGRG